MLHINKYNYFTIKTPYIFIKDENGDESENELALKCIKNK
jgi:hypothetical protein